MNRFEREHVDGIGDGLSMAMGILERADSLEAARGMVRGELLRAREAKDRDNARALRELTAASPSPA
jgi:hypothetical protein